MAILTADNVIDTYDKAAKIQQRASENYREYERIARGLPLPHVRDPMPKITEKTTATILRELYKRACPDVPRAQLRVKDEVARCILEYKVNKYILPNCDKQFPFHAKCQMIFYAGAMYGSQFVSVVEKNDEGDFGVDFELNYQGNCVLAQGMMSVWDRGTVFVETFWTPEDIKTFVEEERLNEEKTGKDSDINLTEFTRAAKDAHYAGDSYGDISLAFESDIERPSEIVRVVKAYQDGEDANTFWFIKEANIGVIATIPNKDYGGLKPITGHYHEFSPLSPYGTGICETLIGDQNAADTTYQYKYRAELNALLPTLLATAVENVRNLKLGNNAIMSLGSDPNAKLEPLTTSSDAVATYIQDASNKRNNMRTAAGLPDTSASADYGLPGRSKTDTGVKTTNNVVNSILNTTRKNFEQFFGRLCLLLIRKWLSHYDNVEEMEIDRETFLKINRIASDKQLEAGLLKTENGKMYVKVDWSEMKREHLKGAEMVITTDWQVDRFERAANLSQNLTLWMTHPAFDTMFNFKAIATQILSDYGVEPYKLLNDDTQDPNSQAVTLPLVEQRAEEIARQVVSDEKQRRAISVEDMDEESAKVEIEKVTGQPVQGELPHIRKLDIEEFEAETKRIQATQNPNAGAPNEQQEEDPRQAKAEIVDYALQSGIAPDDPRLAQVLRIAELKEKGQLDAAQAEAQIQELIGAGSGQPVAN